MNSVQTKALRFKHIDLISFILLSNFEEISFHALYFLTYEFCNYVRLHMSS